MPRPGRLLLLLVPVALTLGLSALAVPGRAQSGSRFAFADTTLLRDTLDLHFAGIFEKADSLQWGQWGPDTLRALMIRYRLPLTRLIWMADSMAVPVDSVGPVLLRERFNPLAGRSGQAVTSRQFKYTSSYDIQKTRTIWTNGSDFNFRRGPIFLQNSTNVAIDRTHTGQRLQLRQERRSDSEVGYRFSPSFSLGGRAGLSRFSSFDPRSTSNQDESINRFEFSTRTRQQPFRGTNSDLNLFSGLIDQKSSTLIKRGLSGDFNGRVRTVLGNWFSHDLSGGVNGNMSRTRTPSATRSLNTSDLASNLRGALALYQNTPIGLNLNYGVRQSRVETPTETDSINRIRTSGRNVDATVRFRRDNDRYLNVTGRVGTSSFVNGIRNEGGIRTQGRYALRTAAFDASYEDKFVRQKYPRRNGTFGYNENQEERSAEGTLTRPFGTKLTSKVTASISLSQYRYVPTDAAATPPTPRDSYSQSYRGEMLYNRSERISTGLGLDVRLVRSINLPARSTASNTDTRSYRGEWRWSYRMLRGLTVAQTNTITADYRFYPFAPERNDLSLDYNTITNLAAVLTPRFSIDVSHNARQQPRGNYVRQPDGLEYLLPADDNRAYTLRSRVTYSPSPALSLTVSPEYLATDRLVTTNGAEVPQRENRHLNMSGGAVLNFRVGQKGRLNGTINRSFNADRTIQYQSGVAKAPERSEQDFWNGSLQLTWEL